jgi:ribonuclease HI
MYVIFDGVEEQPTPAILVDGFASMNVGGRMGTHGAGGYIVGTTNQIITRFDGTGETNNFWELAGICAAIKRVKFNGAKSAIIYSDSQTAIAWLKNKKAKKGTKNIEKIAKMIAYAIANGEGIVIKKWDTTKWGEIPVDPGNKN